MARFNRDDLIEVYTWTEVHPDDPRVCGTPDCTRFNCDDGHEVLYLINAMMSEWDLISKKSGSKMERMLKDLPSEISSQEEALTWVKDKWKSYKFKKAKGKAKPLKGPAQYIPESVPEPAPHNEMSSQNHHHYCASCNSITPCTPVELPSSEPIDIRLLQALSGIHYLKRQRKCTHCDTEFETVEIESSMLYELMRMKSLVDKFTSELEVAINADKRK